MTGRTWRRWWRPAAGLALVALLVLRVGGAPFVEGLRRTSPAALLAALVITAVTTACCAWRWHLVAGSLGVPVGRGAAFAAYYRSQLLNATLPGGVLGDVERAVDHGRRAGRLGRAAGVVVWERSLGQVVQVALAVAVLYAVPSPLRPDATIVAVAATSVLVAVLLVRGPGRRLVRPVVRPLVDDARRLQRDRRLLPVLLVSAIAAAGHVAIFLIAVAAAGVPASPTRMLPVACVVLLAASVPTSFAGWGPREGAAAWAFTAVGLTAADGVTVSVVYGVMAFVATLPGLIVLVGRRRRAPERVPQPRAPIEEVVGA